MHFGDLVDKLVTINPFSSRLAGRDAGFPCQGELSEAPTCTRDSNEGRATPGYSFPHTPNLFTPAAGLEPAY